VLGNEEVLDHDPARAGAAHTERVPVVDDPVGVARERGPAGVGDLPSGRVDHADAADEVRRGVAARAVVPPAFDPKAAVDRDRLGGQVGQRAAEVAVAEQLDLSLLGPHRHRVRVARGQRVDPTARRAAARQLDRDTQEGLEAELVAAEAPRLQDAEEAGLDVLAIRDVGKAPLGLALRLARAKGVAHRRGARDELVRGEVGLGNADAAPIRLDRHAAATAFLRPPARARPRRAFGAAASTRPCRNSPV
jgi:hypothetical protein